MVDIKNESYNNSSFERAFAASDSGKSAHTGMHGVRTAGHLNPLIRLIGWLSGSLISFKASDGSKVLLVRKSMIEFLKRNRQENESIENLSGLKITDMLCRVLQKTNTPAIAFKAVDSSQLVSCPGMSKRENFMDNKTHVLQPVVIGKSPFVPHSMAEHLMKNKRDAAIAKKYVAQSKISNMEGAMHTFVTPVTAILMTADYRHKGGHSAQPVGADKARNVILSAAIHPDFECEGDGEVVMRIVEAKDVAQEGQDFSGFFPVRDFQSKPTPEYEMQLQRHMIYHLTRDHKLPAKGGMQTWTQQKLEELIGSEKTDMVGELQNTCVVMNGHTICLEAMLQSYIHQVRNEFKVLNPLLTQGFVYTIDPPRIFAKQIGVDNVTLLNRLQMLAFKHLKHEDPSLFSNLKMVGFGNFADPNAPAHLAKVFPDKIVQSKADLFKGPDQTYSVKEKYALVVHNNSDAFGQNIETEGPSSMDGVIGSYSDAACQLRRDREDLTAHIR